MPTLTNKILNDSFKLCLHETPDLNILVKIILGASGQKRIDPMIDQKARKHPFVDILLEMEKS